MSNVNFNWETSINGEDTRTCHGKEKHSAPYAYFSKNGKLCLSINNFKEKEVAIGYDEDNNTIVLIDEKYAPNGAPTRRMKLVSKQAKTTYYCNLAVLINTLYKQGKIKGFAYRNRVIIGISKTQITIYLDFPVEML